MNTNLRKRILKIGALIMVLAALTVGIALPAHADNGHSAKNPVFHIVQGKVTSIDVTNTSFELMTANGDEVNIITNASTQFFVVPAGKAKGAVNSLISPGKNESIGKGKGSPKENPAMRLKELKELHIPANWRSNLGWLAFFDTPAGFSDIEINDRVIVRADADNLAKQVLIIKAPIIRTIKGQVALIDSTHIRITPEGGDPLTLTVVNISSIILHGQTSISGYAVAVYNSNTNNIVRINVYAAAPTDD